MVDGFCLHESAFAKQNGQDNSLHSHKKQAFPRFFRKLTHLFLPFVKDRSFCRSCELCSNPVEGADIGPGSRKNSPL